MVETVQYTVEAPQLALIDWLVFLGPCAQVHGQGFPRHQGGEGVAGTPGACSQVFCHPIRCIVGTCQDRLAVSLIIRTTHTTQTTPRETEREDKTEDRRQKRRRQDRRQDRRQKTQDTRHTTEDRRQKTEERGERREDERR